MEYIKKEDLIIGEIYNSTTGFHIFKYIDKNESDNLYCNNRSRFGKEKATVGIGLDNIVNATPEEKHWLEECIKLDKFITFEEAMKSFIPEYVECIKEEKAYNFYGELGIIYKVANWNYSINDCMLEGTTSGSTCKNRFKPSTKEAYDAQFVVKEPEFILPEKWCIRRNLNNFKIINKYFANKFPHLMPPSYSSDSIGSTEISWTSCVNGYTEITFEQFKKHVLKEETIKEKVIEPLPQFKVIETIETITKVENNEGNQFFIGDIVKSEPNVIQTIKSFKYNANKTNLMAVTSRFTIDGININKIEHYIEPKVEVKPEFILPEKWCIKNSKDMFDNIKDWFKINLGRIPTDPSQSSYWHFPEIEKGVSTASIINNNHTESHLINLRNMS